MTFASCQCSGLHDPWTTIARIQPTDLPDRPHRSHGSDTQAFGCCFVEMTSGCYGGGDAPLDRTSWRDPLLQEAVIIQPDRFI
jgi:hypothetical protein